MSLMGLMASAGGGAIMCVEDTTSVCVVAESPVPRGGVQNAQAGECLGAYMGNELASIVGRVLGLR